MAFVFLVFFFSCFFQLIFIKFLHIHGEMLVRTLISWAATSFWWECVVCWLCCLPALLLLVFNVQSPSGRTSAALSLCVAGTSLASWVALLLFLCVLTVQFSLLEVITASVLLFLLTRGARLSMLHSTQNSSSCRPMLSVWVWLCVHVCACAYRTHAGACDSGLKWAWSKLISILFPLVRDLLVFGQCCLDLVLVKIQNSK